MIAAAFKNWKYQPLVLGILQFKTESWGAKSSFVTACYVGHLDNISSVSAYDWKTCIKWGTLLSVASISELPQSEQIKCDDLDDMLGGFVLRHVDSLTALGEITCRQC